MRYIATSLVVLTMGMQGGALWAQSASRRVVTPEQYERWKKELSNWGRWGKDDQIGAQPLELKETGT